MAKEKISNEDKMWIDKMNLHGSASIEAFANYAKVSMATVYKAKREGKLLNELNETKRICRELIVQNEMLKMSARKSARKR